MPALTDDTRAALFMMASMAGFVLNDTLMKATAAELDLFQAIFLRGIVATGLVALLAARAGVLRAPLRGRDGRLVGLRCAAEVGSTFCFLTALFNMPIADATAILQSVPLAVTLGAALFLREPVGWRRYLAIAAGFAGVLLIVRPGGEGFTIYALWACASVGFIVLRDLSTRRLSPHVPSLQVTLLASLTITLAAGAAAPFAAPWAPVSAGAAAALAAAACCLVVGYLFGVMTMRVGSIGFVQPFRYTSLLWAIVLGIAVFDEWPDALTVAGGAVVVATGLFTLHREGRLARASIRGTASAARPDGAASR